MCRVNKMVVNPAGLGIGNKCLDGQIVESVVSLAMVCQFLCIVVVNSLPMELQWGECWFLSVVFVGITGN